MNTQQIRQWFFLNRRLLPWREDPSPYAVWVSEVMLQQTQVAVVVPYFNKWMILFPTIKALAEARFELVIKTWEGLGYYSRVRNLHEGARYLVKNHRGELPPTYEELEKIKGLGPYTIGAILSFAFKQRKAAVDGNILRLFSRFYGIEESIDQGKVKKRIQNLCQDLLPKDDPWIIMEGLIELGALVCKKKARCHVCPLQEKCMAQRLCKTDVLPQKNKRGNTICLHRNVAIIYTETSLLIRKGKRGKVMEGLAEFPYFERGLCVAKTLGLSLTLISSLSQVTHGFTKYKAFLYPFLYRSIYKEVNNYEWVLFEKIATLPFSSGHRRILRILSEKKLLTSL